MGEHWRMPSGHGKRHLLADKGPFPSETIVNDGWVAGGEQECPTAGSDGRERPLEGIHNLAQRKKFGLLDVASLGGLL